MEYLLISHRGNLEGSNSDLENNPKYIEEEVLPTYNCEVDLRFNEDENSLYLGHDSFQYKISFSWLVKNHEKLWIHCKDFESLNFLSRNKNKNKFNYFWHENDSFTLTSQGYIWTFPNSTFYGNKSINVNIGQELSHGEYHGICSDFVSNLKFIT